MLRSILITAAATAVLAVGAVSAFASNSHGKAVSHLARTTTLEAAARAEAVSTLASSKGDVIADAAKADAKTDAAAREAEQDTDEADEATDESTEASDTDADAHGAAVSKVAKSDATAAHQTGEKKVNHGGAVSAVAQKH
ncbi:MAG TPA: hypothetical protein VFR68_02495 [Candidatus Dormibacteraeota bacterium]|nr:hypothetical protein [Candidatus Dormibacteraeota bacterium]